jgi:hypothetical protein
MAEERCVECGGHHYGLRHGQWLRVRESVRAELVRERDAGVGPLLTADERIELRRSAEWASLAKRALEHIEHTDGTIATQNTEMERLNDVILRRDRELAEAGQRQERLREALTLALRSANSQEAWQAAVEVALVALTAAQ